MGAGQAPGGAKAEATAGARLCSVVKGFGVTLSARGRHEGVCEVQMRVALEQDEAALAGRRPLGRCCGVWEGGGRDLTRVGAVETQRIPESWEREMAGLSD